METFPRDVQKENLMCFLHVMCLDQQGPGGIIGTPTSQGTMQR